MKADRTAKELAECCKQWGITLKTYTPGDGVTRYQFYSHDQNTESETAMIVALGLGEACGTFYAIKAGIIVGLGGHHSPALRNYLKQFREPAQS